MKFGTPIRLGWLVFTILAGTVLGIGGAGFRTDPGRTVFTRFAVDVLSDVVHGTAAVDSITGSVVTGLEIWNLRVWGEDGTPFVQLPQTTVRYRLLDFLSRRVVLGQIILYEPFINLVQHPNGRFNHEEVLGLGGSGDGEGGGSSPLIAFRDAEVNGGHLLIRTPSDPPDVGESFETDRGPDGLMRVRRFEHINANLSYVRIASPFPDEEGLRFDIDDLRARMSDPALDMRRVAGRIEIDGRVLHMDLDEFELPGSAGSVVGRLHWPEGRLLLDLVADASRLSINDARPFVGRLPWNMVGRGRLTLQSFPQDSILIATEQMVLNAPGGGGTMRGRFAGVAGSQGLSDVRDTELVFDSLDIDYVRPLLDTIPFDGRLSGRLAADGPMQLLETEIDWQFYDALVDGTPETRLHGSGSVALGVPGEFVFYNFRLDSGDVALSTVERIVPAVALRGRMDGDGRLNGAWRNVEFAGTLRHRDGDLPVTGASGVIRLDTRGDTVGVWADLVLDSLSLAGIQPSYSQLPRTGVFRGTANLAGYLDSLSLRVDLSGPGGSVAGQATAILLPETRAMHAIDAGFTRLNLRRFDSTLVTTELYGALQGGFRVDTGATPAADFQLTLDTSYVAGSPIDSVRGGIRISEQLAEVDSLSLWGPRLALQADGDFGLAAPQRGQLMLDAQIDSLGTAEAFLRSMAAFYDQEELFTDVVGTSSAEVTLAGTVGDYDATLLFRTPELVTTSLVLEGLTVDAYWQSADTGGVRITSSLDSLLWNTQSYSDLAFNVTGRKHVSEWFARGRIGVDGSAVGWGHAFRDEQVTTLPIDSVRLLLPSGVWGLNPGALVSWSDSGVVFRNVDLTSIDGGRRISLAGLLPARAEGSLETSVVLLPVGDLWALLQQDPTEVGGELGGTFLLEGTGAMPLIEGVVNLRQGRFGQFRIPQLLGAIDYRRRRLVGDFLLQRGGDSILTLVMDLPIDLALETVSQRQLPGPLSIRAEADGVDLSFMNLIGPYVRDAAGTLNANFGIAGTWDSPQLTGFVEVEDGSARFPALGTRHRDLNGRVVLSGDTIRIERLAVASGEGRAAATGYLRMEGLTRPRLNFQIAADRFAAIDVPGFLTMTASGDLALTGPVFGAQLTGEGTVPSGVLYFADLLEKNVINLEDSLYASLIDPNALADRGLREPFENRFLDSLTIRNLQVTAGNDMWLRSSEANIQLRGELTVNKTGRQYRYDGTMSTPRGTYRLPFVGSGREFEVTGGEVQYFGTPDLNAAVDINARRSVRTVQDNVLNVFVHVGGTLYEPELALTSDHQPPLPEQEILSYLLFGQPSFGLASGESSQLGLAAASLGTAAFGELSSQLEQLLIGDLGVPVDYLQIRAGDITQGGGIARLTELQLSVGWQIGEQIFVTVSPRICEEVNLNRGVGNIELLYPAFEYRFAPSWRLSLSADPARPCDAFSARALDFRTQWGADLLWDKRY